MRLSRVACVGIAFAIAGAAQPSLACVLTGNPYEWDQRGRLEAAWRDAVFIERLAVEIAGETDCPDTPSIAANDEVWEQYFETAPEVCQTGMLPDADLTGVTLERFKGSGPDRVPLRGRHDPSGRPFAFTDIRSLADEDSAILVDWEERRAQEGHFRPRFWLNGDIGFGEDLTTSCGGRPFLAPGLDYVVFRDAGGQVIVAEPVSRGDDALAAWLRQSSSHASPRVFSAREAFEAASNLVLVQITRCDPPGPYDDWESVVFARLLRGGRNQILPSNGEADVSEAVEANYLDAWFAYRGTPCAPMDLLVVETNEPYGADGDAFPSRVWIPPMPAVVTDGRVRVADLFPGVALTGPEWVTVDEAFAWFEAAPTMDDL